MDYKIKNFHQFFHVCISDKHPLRYYLYCNNITDYKLLTNAALFSLGIECLLNLLSLSMAISLDSVVKYPRFIPFCTVLGIVALLGLVAMLVLNIKISEKFNFTKPIWIFEYALALVLSIPMIKIWETLFEFLQKAV